jgi:hypothetical protein
MIYNNNKDANSVLTHSRWVAAVDEDDEETPEATEKLRSLQRALVNGPF